MMGQQCIQPVAKQAVVKSNPLINKLQDSVARSSVQPDIYAQCFRTRHKML